MKRFMTDSWAKIGTHTPEGFRPTSPPAAAAAIPAAETAEAARQHKHHVPAAATAAKAKAVAAAKANSAAASKAIEAAAPVQPAGKPGAAVAKHGAPAAKQSPVAAAEAAPAAAPAAAPGAAGKHAAPPAQAKPSTELARAGGKPVEGPAAPLTTRKSGGKAALETRLSEGGLDGPRHSQEAGCAAPSAGPPQPAVHQASRQAGWLPARCCVPSPGAWWETWAGEGGVCTGRASCPSRSPPTCSGLWGCPGSTAAPRRPPRQARRCAAARQRPLTLLPAWLVSGVFRPHVARVVEADLQCCRDHCAPCPDSYRTTAPHTSPRRLTQVGTVDHGLLAAGHLRTCGASGH